ncbi:MAG: PhzF family phenazine biosynthesis protein [Isosphaeraceae bacterium]
MSVRIIQVDAFTPRPFAGNPAAVCLLDAPVPESWMQQVAREMNLSETAFVERRSDDGVLGLRWFTPTVEVDLCGHATLAAAHVLWEEHRLDPSRPALFDTRSGRLAARKRDDWIELDFPSTPVGDGLPAAELEPIARALAAEPVFGGRSRFDLLVELASEAEVRRLAPDFRRLSSLPVRGVIATALSGSHECDFVSRFFAPAAGVDEDPVTGSAHCCLAPYWALRLGRSELVGHQVSDRGGVVKVCLDGDRVAILGQAVTVMRGELVTD